MNENDVMLLISQLWLMTSFVVNKNRVLSSTAMIIGFVCLFGYATKVLIF